MQDHDPVAPVKYVAPMSAWELLWFAPPIICSVVGALVFVIPIWFHKSILIPGALFQTFLLSPYVAIYTASVLIFSLRQHGTRRLKALQVVIGGLCLLVLIKYTLIIMRQELAGGWSGR